MTANAAATIVLSELAIVKGVAVGARLLSGAGAVTSGGVAVAEVTAASAQAAEGAELADGSFSITNWSGYPAGIPRPTGPVDVLTGDAYTAARAAADQANVSIRAANGLEGTGLQIHEIQPVKFGGSPTDMATRCYCPQPNMLDRTEYTRSFGLRYCDGSKVEAVNTMQIEEFLKHVASEPERTVTRTVWTTPPDMLAKAANPRGLMMADMLSAPGRRPEQREVRYRHILGSPATQQEIDDWHRQRPSHALPSDLRELISRVDGIHLWANPETGRSYAGLAPIAEWDLARIKMYGPAADQGLLADRYVAVSYHEDGASFVVLDVESGRYFLMDAAGPETTSPIATNAGELLDWLWRSRIAPKA